MRTLIASSAFVVGLLAGCSGPVPSAGTQHPRRSTSEALRLLVDDAPVPGPERDHPVALLRSAVYERRGACLVLRDAESGETYTPLLPYGSRLESLDGRDVLVLPGLPRISLGAAMAVGGGEAASVAPPRGCGAKVWVVTPFMHAPQGSVRPPPT